jgi:high-affinity nickel-transport protein
MPMYLMVPIGFDTAASIALIAVSAIAHKGANGVSIPSSNVIILPVKTILYSLPWLLELQLLLQLLFTAGMTLVDSADSVLVLYSYAGLPSTPSWSLITRTKPEENVGMHTDRKDDVSPTQTIPHDQVKMNAMSTLSITLTFMSILVAFSISLITIMGLIGERCSQCAAAANAEDGGGLAGSWWRAWARVCICSFVLFCWRCGSVIIQANDNSGYIGVAIIGMFLVLGVGWLLRAWLGRRSRRGQAVSSE